MRTQQKHSTPKRDEQEFTTYYDVQDKDTRPITVLTSIHNISTSAYAESSQKNIREKTQKLKRKKTKIKQSEHRSSSPQIQNRPNVTQIKPTNKIHPKSSSDDSTSSFKSSSDSDTIQTLDSAKVLQ
jgi:hypothetical protein